MSDLPRVVVNEDDRCRALRDGLAKDLARMHERGVQYPASHKDVAIDAVLRIEYGDVEFLNGAIVEARTKAAFAFG